MNAGLEVAVESSPPRADLLRRAAALGVIVVILADLLLLASGAPSLCSECGQAENHLGLLLLGLAGWGGYVVFERRLPAPIRGAYLGALTGQSHRPA